jgi:hypothetical protein
MRQNPFPHCLTASGYSSALAAAPAATVVHLLDISCPIAKLRNFMSDTRQWLPWTMPALQSVQPLPFGQWLLKTPRQVLVRTGSTATGCRVAITLHKHQPLPRPVCTTSVRHLLRGLRSLKLLLEQD